MNDKIIYIGNKLIKHGFSPTSIETLGERLKYSFSVHQSSDKLYKSHRLVDMILCIIRNREARAVLIDTYSTSAFVFAFTAGMVSNLLRIPYVAILRGGDLPRLSHRFGFVVRIYLKKATFVVAPSNYLKHAMVKLLDRNYTVIPNFIDLPNYFFRERILENKIKLLWVRSFHEIYNPFLAVDIVKGLINRGFSVELAMVGSEKDGSMKLTKDYAHELGVVDFIRFTGRLSKPEWIDMAREFDIFINTTNVDNTPVSVMEAMALGMIVVSTNVGGVPYLIENNLEGILVPPKNSESFINVIEGLYSKPSTGLEISRNARLKAENWDWTIVERLWLDLLKTELN